MKAVKQAFLWAMCCGAWSCTSPVDPASLPDSPTQGKIHISVDETYKPVIEEQLAVHHASFPQTTIVAEYKPEADCFRDLQQDSTRMIIVGRGLTEKEADFYKSSLSYKPQYGVLAYDAVALVVNKEAPDSIFTFDRVRDILSGKDKTTAVMDGRSATSTVRFLQDSVLKGSSFGKNVVAVDNSEAVLDVVSRRKDLIGFVGFSWIGDAYDPGQRALLNKLRLAMVECTACLENGVFAKPSQATVTRGEYPFRRPIYYILKENTNQLGTGFMNFMSLERGQLIFRRAFLAPAKMAFHRRNGSIKEE
ncbi:MAG: hypothetical protein EAZ62_04805 [Sphingobacteriia bacterium]|nr:MAG: hypothetical protein EAZ62_04805 [Sphingobacteriia bacterium]